MDDLQSRIRERAYQLWEQAGRPHGHDVEHWLQAEKSLESAAGSPKPRRRSGGGARKGSGRTRKAGGTPAGSR